MHSSRRRKGRRASNGTRHTPCSEFPCIILRCLRPADAPAKWPWCLVPACSRRNLVGRSPSPRNCSFAGRASSRCNRSSFHLRRQL